MKITVFNPQSEFTKEQQKKLASLGNVIYTQTRAELPLHKLIALAKGADVIAVDPDPLGGFEKAKETLTSVMNTLPHLKGLCLSTTSYGWIDLDYCKKRSIPVSNIPDYSRESIAEHTLALLLCLAKRILVTDRKTQKGNYKLEMGFEARGKTLGVLGLGSIGSRVAELGNVIGMKVIAYNRSAKVQKDVTMKRFHEILQESDVLSLHVTHEEGNKNMINKDVLAKMKQGVVIVNTADRELVDEQAMADAIKSGKVFGYVYEAENLENTPLTHLENAIGIKGYGWYTKEALQNLFQIWIENIVSLAKGKPKNRVS